VNFKLILPQRIIFGEGTIKQVGEQVKRLGGNRTVIVTSEGMRKRECLSQVVDLLHDSDVNPVIFSEVTPDPSSDNMLGCVSFTYEALWGLTVGLDGGVVIGLGGGSVMDVAKKVATDLGLLKIMVPTTAGSGSEVTHDVVFKVDGKKRGSADERLVADVAIIDPDLLKTLPQRLMVASAIDALSHSIESYQAKRGNVLTQDLAFKACEFIDNSLCWGIDGLQDARVGLAMGSLLSGMAFGNSGTTLCHALSYPLSNRGMSHGEAVAVMLPYAIGFNGYEDGFDECLVARLSEMVSKVGIGASYDGDIEEMAKEVMEDERHLSNNPREVRFEDVVRIYKEAMACVTAR